MPIARRDANALQQLSRSELQYIAHKEGIKANQKSVVIIQQLLEKHPTGVPRPATPKPSAPILNSLLSMKEGREKPNRIPDGPSNVVGSPETGPTVRIPTISPTVSTVPASASPARPKRQLGKPQATHQHRTEAEIEQWRESNAGTDAGPGVMNPSTKRVRVSMNVSEIPTQPAKKQKMGPGPKDVRYVLCQLSKNVNYLPHYERMLRDMTGILGEAKEICDNIEKEVGEICVFRWLVEEDIVKKMKQDKSLVDGTTRLGSNDGLRAKS